MEQPVTVTANRRLAEQTVLVLGGAGNMGLATAKLAAVEGAHVILLGRRQETLERAVRQLPEGSASVRFVVGDATDEVQMKHIFTQIGAVDHVVAATSSGTPQVKPPAATIPLVDLSAAHAVYSRLWAAYNVLHLASQYVLGTVTIISGASARRPQFGYGVYGALHGALEALARAAAVELAPLRVNVVSPGCLGVPPMDQLAHHYGQFEDLASAVVALITNPAITATVLDVDGGESLGTWSGDSTMTDSGELAVPQ
jgi:NAD(P)-dependent dehydrogenase (short-subunit alcohol dehydrogenase family)